MLAAGVKPPSAPQKELLARHARASISQVLLVVGAFYAVVSGAVFLSIPEAWASHMWVATVILGLLLASGGWAVRRWTLSHVTFNFLLGGLATLVVLHNLALIWVAKAPDLALSLAMILGGAGFMLMPRPALAAVHVIGLLGWVLLARDLELPLAGSGTALVVAGLGVGWAANVIRARLARHQLQAHAVVQGTLAASEERFRSLAETATDGIFLLDGEGRLTYLNPAGLSLFGLRPNEAAGRFLSQHLGSSATSPTDLVGTREMAVQRRDGSTFSAELSMARTERDGLIFYTGILRDVTERKRAMEVTQKATARGAEVDRLQQMNEFKTRFLNMAAHELTTPLTPLRLQLHMLKDLQLGPLNAKQGQAVSVLDRNVTRLSGLVGELLEVARLQSGGLRLQVQTVALDDVVDEVLESFGEVAQRVGITLTYAGLQNLVVQADRLRTTQVLSNLVSNAMKFTPAGGRVTLDAADLGTRVEVTIMDTGLGLTAEQQGRLFQPFSQVHDPMAITASGTGLGLYICKGLVEAQGGTISVSSAGPAKGSTFKFTLPTSGSEAVRPVPVRSAYEDPIVRRLRELI